MNWMISVYVSGFFWTFVVLSLIESYYYGKSWDEVRDSNIKTQFYELGQSLELGTMFLISLFWVILVVYVVGNTFFSMLNKLIRKIGISLFERKDGNKK